jgi:hypothetical protein
MGISVVKTPEGDMADAAPMLPEFQAILDRL